MSIEQTAQTHLLVLAGAGTGKTHLLAKRYVDHLQDHSPLEVVAVTFTERAAAELHSRIRLQAQQGGWSGELVAQIDAAPIGTIHALAARICREHSLQAGVPDGFSVMDELQARQWRAVHLPLALDVTAPGILTQLPYSRIMAILEILLKDPYETLRRLTSGTEPERRTEWKGFIDCARQDAWHELLQSLPWQAAWQQLQMVQGLPTDRLEQLRRHVIQALERPPLSVVQVATLVSDIKLNVGSKKAWPDDELQVAKGALEALRELVKMRPLLTLEWNAQDDALLATASAVEAAFRAVHEQLYRWRSTQGQLEFADLEGRALIALTYPEVRTFYQRRFKALLVDECQDTSPAQLSLLRGVSEGAIKTYVGDPLQSIYGFRTGRQPLHHQLDLEITELGGQRTELTTSYRANRELIEPLNKAMGHLTAGEHLPLQAVRAAPEAAATLTFLEVNVQGSRRLRLQAEAHCVAQEIQTLLTSQTLIFDPLLAATRPIQPRDLAILARAWKPLDTFQAALVERRIPAFQAGGGDLLQTVPARDAWTLLRAAGDPTDDLATAAALRGPLFNWNETQLHQLWASLLDKESWQAALNRSGQREHQRAKDFFQRLKTLRLSPPVEVLLLADRFGYRHQVAQQWDAARVLADWDAMLMLLMKLEPDCPTPRAAAYRLRRWLGEKVRLPRPPIAVTDAVTLASIHHAKGMEWPVVFVVDLDGTRRPDSSPAYVAEQGVVYAPDPFEKQRPAMVELAKAHSARLVDAELNRLLYVASTRARDRLYASSPAGSQAAAHVRLHESFKNAGAAVRLSLGPQEA